MNKSSHTHELRYHDYTKGTSHNKVLAVGTCEECTDVLKKIVAKENEDHNRAFGIGLYLNNMGYSIVELAYEKLKNIEKVAPKMLALLQRFAMVSLDNRSKSELELIHKDAFELIKEFN